MKELLILRHAKSSWKHAELEDHARPLNKRGRRDAPRMGRWILQRELLPGVIVTSTAVRASTTANLVAGAAGFRGPLHATPELYLGGYESYLEQVARHGADHGRALVVGHNPDVEDLLTALTGARETMPTAALAHVRLQISTWAEASPTARGKLLGLWRPKELPQET